MGQVISIFKNVQHRNRMDLEILDRNMSSTCSMSTVDELITMELDVGLFGQSEKILAHVIASSEFDKVVVFSDANGESISRSIPTIKNEFPAHYKVVKLGELDAFFEMHKDDLAEILIHESNLHHGRLTLARALRIMTLEKLSPSQSLARAISISTRCRKFEHAIRNAVQSMYKHYI